MTGSQPNASEWIDISVPLRTGLVHWPGDPEPTFERISEIEQGAEANVTFCKMTAHTGTHMDAPCHFIGGAAGIDQFPLQVGIGPARVVTVPSGCSAVGQSELEAVGVERGDRILLKTRNSRAQWHEQDFKTDFVGVNASGARYLRDRGARMIGVDYLSVGLFEGDGAETHKTLLSGGVWIVEGLDLANVEEGEYDLVCLPLRIVGSDGSPVRAALRTRSNRTTNA
jgi:arylformamidase